MKYFLALLAIIVGSLMVIKTAWFVQTFGRSSWGEKYFGNGGTYTMYKVFGIVVIIVAVFGATGLMGQIILSIFGGLFGGLA